MHYTLIAILAVVGYLASGLIIAVRLFRSAQDVPPRGLALLIGFAAIVLHAVVVYQNIFTGAGLNFAFFNALSLITWTVATLLLLSSLGKPVENLGILLLPLAALAIVLELLYPSSRSLGEPGTLGLKIHILVSLLAYSLLTLAAVQAVLLAIQDQHLRNRHPGGFVRALPPLQTMEKLLFEMIAVGFFLLSLALVSGFMFLEDLFAQHLVHKTVLSIASWIVFGVLLWGRYRFGWRGRTAIGWTLGGFAVLMLAYLGSKAVLELILKR